MEIYNFPSFMHWLLIVNASTNFLIYCFMGNKFKTVLMSMVRDLVKGKEQATSMVMMVDASGVKRDISKVSIKLAPLFNCLSQNGDLGGKVEKLTTQL